MPVERVRPAPLDLVQPARALGVDHAGCVFELVEIPHELVVRRCADVIDTQLIQRGPQRPIGPTVTNRGSTVCELSHTREAERIGATGGSERAGR